MFDIKTVRHATYLEIICKGPADFASLQDVVDKIAQGYFEQASMRKYLIDLRPIIGTIGTLERFKLGVYIAEKIPGYKVAAISKSETHDKMGENVAVNRGANILATDSEEQAREWLLSSGVFLD